MIFKGARVAAGVFSKMAAVILLLISSPVFAAQTETGAQLIRADDLLTRDQIIYLTDQWKYFPGDDGQFANPGYDDSEWVRSAPT